MGSGVERRLGEKKDEGSCSTVDCVNGKRNGEAIDEDMMMIGENDES